MLFLNGLRNSYVELTQDLIAWLAAAAAAEIRAVGPAETTSAHPHRLDDIHLMQALEAIQKAGMREDRPD